MPDVRYIVMANALRRQEAVRLLQVFREQVATGPDAPSPVLSPTRQMADAEAALTWAGWYALPESATREERLRVVDAAIASLVRRDTP